MNVILYEMNPDGSTDPERKREMDEMKERRERAIKKLDAVKRWAGGDNSALSDEEIEHLRNPEAAIETLFKLTKESGRIEAEKEADDLLDKVQSRLQ